LRERIEVIFQGAFRFAGLKIQKPLKHGRKLIEEGAERAIHSLTNSNP
jgi:hypothetical protein